MPDRVLCAVEPVLRRSLFGRDVEVEPDDAGDVAEEPLALDPVRKAVEVLDVDLDSREGREELSDLLFRDEVGVRGARAVVQLPEHLVRLGPAHAPDAVAQSEGSLAKRVAVIQHHDGPAARAERTVNLSDASAQVSRVVEAADRIDVVEALVLPGKLESRRDPHVAGPPEPLQALLHHRHVLRGYVRAVIVGPALCEELAERSETEADLEHLLPGKIPGD